MMLRPAELRSFGMANLETPAARALPTYSHFIGGSAHEPQSREYLPTDDPYTGKAWARIARGNRADVDAAVGAARRAFDAGAWPAMTPSERGRLLWRFADAIAANAERLAEIERRDNGKLAVEVTAQVRYMADYFQLLRRNRRQDSRRGHPHRQERRVRLHEPRAEGGRRDHHAVELPADAD